MIDMNAMTIFTPVPTVHGAMPLPQRLRKKQRQHQHSHPHRVGMRAQSRGAQAEHVQALQQELQTVLLNSHRIGHAVVQAIGVVLQNRKLTFHHHCFHGIFDGRFGLDFNHAFRPASCAKRAG